MPPSRSWTKGSTRRWRRLREYVLRRDGYRCQLGLPGCTTYAPLKGGHVHHTRGRSLTGDDPDHMVAACQHCNLSLGEPTEVDPMPIPRTRW